MDIYSFINSSDIADYLRQIDYKFNSLETYHEGMYNYMDLVYYKGPFTGIRRALIAVSNYMKGKIELELLLCAYKKVLLDEFADGIMLRSWFTKEGLELARLQKLENPEEV